MTEETIVKAPDQAVVAKATSKVEAGEDLNQKEAAALEAQNAIDEERGYRRILWQPAQNIWMWQHIATQHTTPDGEAGEAAMRRWHNEYRMGQLRG